MGLFFLIEMLLELAHFLLQIPIDLQISLDDPLHVVYVILNIIVFSSHSLDFRDQLSLFSKELGCFFQVLEMLIPELFFFVNDSVYLFMESQQFLRPNT
jgi:hypothetical protein